MNELLVLLILAFFLVLSQYCVQTVAEEETKAQKDAKLNENKNTAFRNSTSQEKLEAS